MTRTLILHIGCHKTGTSAIQDACVDNQNFLHQNGWHFAVSPNNVPNWGEWFQFETQGEETYFGLKAAFFDKIEVALSQDHENVILSSEDFFFLEDEDIHRLAKCISPLFDKIIICAYLRRQDQLAISQKAQGARTVQSALVFGFDSGALPQLTPSVRRYLDFSHKLSLWQDAFPKAELSVREYLRATLQGGDIVRDFFSQIGLHLEGTDRGVNASMGANEVQFLLKLRDWGLKQSEIERILAYGWIERTSTPGSLTVARQDAQDFYSHFSETNDRLSQIVGRDFTFNNDFSGYPETAQSTGYDAYERDCLFTLVMRFFDFIPMERVFAIRDIALALETRNPRFAMTLSEMALDMHPKGPAISDLYKRLHGNGGAT